MSHFVEPESKDVIVLGAIKKGAKNFDKIRKAAQIEPEELDSILERLEQRGLIEVQEKKGLFGKKIEIFVTEKGQNELEHRIHELNENWNQMQALYKSGDKQKLQEELEKNRGFFPMMIFFGIIDMIMFSMMFSMIGATMHDYVPAENIPEGMDETGGEQGDSGSMDDGGFDIDIGF
jgi:DNA-binding HxlR family transcriptional regulator